MKQRSIYASHEIKYERYIEKKISEPHLKNERLIQVDSELLCNHFDALDYAGNT